MNKNPKNPYVAIKRQLENLVFELKNPSKVKSSWFEGKLAKDGSSFKMDAIYQAVKTSQSLGWETLIEIDANGDMVIIHRKKPSIPFIV